MSRWLQVQSFTTSMTLFFQTTKKYVFGWERKQNCVSRLRFEIEETKEYNMLFRMTLDNFEAMFNGPNTLESWLGPSWVSTAVDLDIQVG